MPYNIDYKNFDVIEINIVDDVIDNIKQHNYYANDINCNELVQKYNNKDVYMFATKSLTDFVLKYNHEKLNDFMYEFNLTIKYIEKEKKLYITKKLFQGHRWITLIENSEYNIKNL